MAVTLISRIPVISAVKADTDHSKEQQPKYDYVPKLWVFMEN